MCSKSPQVSNLMDIRPVSDELFHADARTHRHSWRRL